MRRRLVLMRHAKSSWDSPADGDHGRPLNERGRQDAPRMARWLADQGWAPDAVLCSTATRTRQTWALAAPHLGAGIPVRFQDRLYLAGLGALQDSSRDWDPDWTTVLALGHNSGWEDAASRLSGQSIGMATAACVLLEATAPSWEAALEQGWRLVGAMRPKLLPDDL